MSVSDLMPEPPPIDYDNWELPEEVFFMPDDPFPDDIFASVPSNFDYEVLNEPWLQDDNRFDLDELKELLDVPSAQNEIGVSQTASLDTNWSWQDARLIGVEREIDNITRFEIGAIDVYANLNTGDLGGSYLPIASFEDVDVAATYYHTLQEQMHDQGLSAHQIPDFAEKQSLLMNHETEQWRSAVPEEYAAYEHLRGLEDESIEGRDEPPDHLIDPLIETAIELGGVGSEIEDQSAIQALNAIGIQAEGFHPTQDPPPFYDAETGTAYWIGVFQADKNDRENCVTSILSLGRNPETGTMEAQLAPCVPGEWDKAYTAAEYLIEVAQRSGIDHCFDAAEGMALATDQRELWEKERGVLLEPDTTQTVSDYTQDNWEMDL
ncbi:MAG: hypothetical protein LCI00_15625 [Chloroflexi bacterium]|nr:hypothetical protein [Chloroflexota bacterium]